MKRFHAAIDIRDDRLRTVILDVPVDEYNEMDEVAKRPHEIVVFQMPAISNTLARHYAMEICKQLNEFDAANLAVAKLNKLT